MSHRIILSTVLLVTFVSIAKGTPHNSAFSISEPKPMAIVDSFPMHPKLVTGTLENGLAYFIQPNEKPEDRAELRLIVKAGSIDEDDDQQGLAHFVEHMAFNGTELYEKNDLIDYLQSTGVRFGPDLNAYTSFDETVYMLEVRTDSMDIFHEGLVILKEWASAVTFDGEEIDKERGVVLSEMRTGLSANQRMRNEYLPVLFKDSKYADRLPIGTKEVLTESEYETLRRYYRDWYRPELMGVAVVGDIEIEEVEKQIKQLFGPLTNPKEPRSKEKFGFPSHEETLVSITSDEEASFTTGQIFYKHDEVKTSSVSDYKGNLIRSLYNRMLNQRLSELRQKADPPFIYASSGYGNQVGTLDAYVTYVNSAEGEIIKGLEQALIENKRVLLHGFSNGEMDRQKAEILSELETAALEEGKFPSKSLASRIVNHFLKGTPVPSAKQRLELTSAILPGIQLEEINTQAEQWIIDSNRVIIITGPEKEETPLPTEQDILDLLSHVDKMDVEPYVEEVDDRPLVENLPAPGNIVEKLELEEVGVTEYALSNGITVVVKPTDFQNDEILMSAFSPGGHSLYSDEDFQSASLASTIVAQAGVADFDLITLQKKLAGKQVNVSPFISELEEGLQGFSTIDDLEILFQLIHLFVTDPRKDKEAFQSLMQRQKQILQNLFVNPNYYFSREANKIKFNDHPRRGIPTIEDLDKISLDRVFDIYIERFRDVSDFTFTFVGNIEQEVFEDLMEKYLANLPAEDRNETWKNVEADYPQGEVTRSFEYGQAPKAQIDVTYHGTIDWDVRKDRAIFGAMADILRDRFRESMREDKGGVYGVRVYDNISKIPDEEYIVNISFNSEPEMVDELIATAKRDIDSLMNFGPKEDEIQKVMETNKQSRIKNLRENRFWSNVLRSYYSYDLPLENVLYDNYENLLDSIEASEIQNMAKLIFSTPNIIEIVMHPGSDEND